MATRRGVWDRTPATILAAGLSTAAFAGLVGVWMALLDVPVGLPSERISLALGVNAAFPVAAGLGCYLWAQAVYWWSRRGDRPGPGVIRAKIATDLAILALFVAVGFFHFNLKTRIFIVHPALYDPLYWAMDRQVQGLVDWAFRVRRGVAQVLPGVDQIYQFGFFATFVIAFVTLSLRNDRFYRRYAFAIIFNMVVGGLGYLVAPAVGPFLYELGLNAQATSAQEGMWWGHQQIQLGGAAWVRDHGAAAFTGGLAAMPSLHAGNGLINLYFTARARPILALVQGPLFLWILIEAVASRWHYVVDLPVGIALAVAVIALAGWIDGLDQRRTEKSRNRAAAAAGRARGSSQAGGRPATRSRYRVAPGRVAK